MYETSWNNNLSDKLLIKLNLQCIWNLSYIDWHNFTINSLKRKYFDYNFINLEDMKTIYRGANLDSEMPNNIPLFSHLTLTWFFQAHLKHLQQTSFKNIMTKEEFAHDEQFLLLPQCCYNSYSFILPSVMEVFHSNASSFLELSLFCPFPQFIFF